MTYQPNIPTGLIDLDVDYQNLQTNFSQLDTQFGVDHIPFSNTSGTFPAGINGIHKVIHFNPFSTVTTNPPNNYPIGTTVVPAATPGYGQLFSCQINDGINTDQALFYLTGGGLLSLLTRNFMPTVGSNGSFENNGYTYLPGGFILQWGNINPQNSNPVNTVTFTSSGNINFPNAMFVGFAMPRRGQAAYTTNITINGETTTGFNINNNNASPTMLAYDWIALGN